MTVLINSEILISFQISGAVEHFKHSNKSHLRKTKGKEEPLAETVAKIKESKIWRMENELYHFARDHFQFIKKKYMTNTGKIQGFSYEKIKPIIKK